MSWHTCHGIKSKRMKYLLLILALAIIGGGVFAITQKTSHTNDKVTSEETPYVVLEDDMLDAAALTAEITVATGALNDAEKAGLLLMREEEKLAHDVYQAFYETWGKQIFSNIAQSEQTHTDAVLALLKHYGIADPALPEAGVFADAELQALYNDLVAEGSSSLVAAYTIGATVEDLDIADLERLMNETTNSDILTVYDNLQRGSRNHLRAFNRQLVASTGADYEPQYISAEAFAAIIAGDTERGGGGGNGRGHNNNQ